MNRSFWGRVKKSCPFLAAATLLVIVAGLALAACASPAAVPSSPPPPEPAPAPSWVHAVSDIPVLAWHQIVGGVAKSTSQDVIWNFNKDCKPTAAVCNAPNTPETVSLSQLNTELAWLHSQGYHSITSGQVLP